ncbi:TetR/AcrR family transcriptional regulator [Deinococcus sonorensis]|uniref:TetR/AcrR family transcriptional regulator n=2 Tax=Deinococcus sonorensis TaxID=309891 RepID=A0AAU7U778_9DEIO
MTRGRPRTFDKRHALQQALKVFWTQGYEGTSLLDLTEAMHINRPSLYSAFGNKEALFRQALDLYADDYFGYVQAALQEPTARQFVERLLLGHADAQTTPGCPAGCLTVQGALATGPEARAITEELNARRAGSEQLIRQRLETARQAGDLPADVDPADLARFVATLSQGMAVQAAAGCSRADLHRVVHLALRAWPDSMPSA